MPVILASSQTVIGSDANGLAAIVPSASVSGSFEIEIIATAGTAAMHQFEVEAINADPAAAGSETDLATPVPMATPSRVATMSTRPTRRDPELP
jgi:hypothetical protein